MYIQLNVTKNMYIYILIIGNIYIIIYIIHILYMGFYYGLLSPHWDAQVQPSLCPRTQGSLPKLHEDQLS